MKKYILVSIALMVTSVLFAQYSTQQIQSFYRSQQSVYGLANEDINSFIVTDQYTSSNGVTHIYLRQVVNGIELFNANSSMHISKEGKLILLNNGFIAGAAQKTTESKPVISTSAAMSAAGNHVGINLNPVMSKADMPMQNNKLTINDATVSPEPVKAGLYYLQTESGLKLVYNIEVFDNTTNDWWNIRVDAADGTVLEKNNWTTHCNVSANMFSNDQNASSNMLMAPMAVAKAAKTTEPTYNVFQFPIESPNHGPRQLINGNPSPTASPYGWHDTDGVDGAEFTLTKGNNVFADEDSMAANANGFSPDGGVNMVFDFPMDSTWMMPGVYLNAAITNLFYANNYVHDVFYRYGFNETAGNFQFNNYGKGGTGRDYVLAEAQDGSGTGNANFSTPVDGSNGRMQMYLWPTTTVTAPKLTVSNSLTASGSYTAPLANFGIKRFADITARVILVDDDSTTTTSLGCSSLENAAELNGNIALIDRGTCGYTQKVLNAQNAGAIAVIMINTSNTATAMTGSSSAIAIPSVMVSSVDGAKIKTAVKNGDTVMATMKGLPVVKAFDSDFDNGVIAHEFGHGISTRLTGGPANSNCLNNAEQAGEGWSDFFALALTAKPGDKGTDARGIGTFVYNENVSDLGIREFKYTTDMSVNPMTYNYIKNNKGVHYVGTVWCSMLWDIYWKMVEKYGFDEDVMNGDGGNNKAIQLVIDGLKLQACGPGFVDARDAILKADSINNGGANRDLLWRAFARRGLGYSASQGSANSVTDGGVTKFDLPPDVTGIADKANLAAYIQLSPNPTTGVATLVLPDQLDKAEVTITDITGKVVISETAYADASQHITIDMSAYQNGLYLVKLTNGATTFQSKLMVNR